MCVCVCVCVRCVCKTLRSGERARGNLEHAPPPPPSSNCNILWLTQQGSEDLEGDKLVVLTELHKGEHQSWKVLRLSKYGRPVRQSGQCPGGMHTLTSVNPTQSSSPTRNLYQSDYWSMILWLISGCGYLCNTLSSFLLLMGYVWWRLAKAGWVPLSRRAL